MILFCTPSTPPRTKNPPSSLNLNRADSTNSFDSSNRGHGKNDTNTTTSSLANTASGRRQLSQTGSSRSGGFSRVNRSGSMRKKISMAEVHLSDDDQKSAKSAPSPPTTRNSQFLNNNNNQSTTSGYSSYNKTRLTVDHNNSLDRNSTPSPSGYKATGSGINSNPALSSSSFKNSINNLRNNDIISNPFGEYSNGEYSGMTKEQLIEMVERQKGELSYRDDQVKKLEEYVDRLLLKIISINPEMLNHDFAPESSEVHETLEKRHNEKKGPMKFLK